MPCPAYSVHLLFSVVSVKIAALGFFPFSQKIQLTLLEKSCKRGCPLNRQQKRASCPETLCCKTSWKVKFLVLSPTFKPVSCVNTNFWLDNFTRESRHTRVDITYSKLLPRAG